MGSEWIKCTLSNIADIQTGPFGSQLHASDYVSDGIPSIMPQNIGDNRIDESGIARITIDDAKRLEKYRVKTGDIVYSRRGDVELRALVRKNENGWLCGTGCLRVRISTPEVDSEFASFYLSTPWSRAWIVQHAHGATMPNLNTSILGEVPFAYPDIEIQRSIAATLSSLDDKIELNNRIIANLEAQAQAIFKSWFVDFEPFQDGEFEESELGLIPRGWRVQTIESVAEKIAMGPFGSNIKVNTFVNEGVPIISGQHLRGLYLDEISYNFISVEHANKMKNSLVYSKDIIFTHAGNIGQVAQIPDDCDYPYYIISQRQFYLRCDRKKVVPEYVNYYFHNAEGQGKLLANATQTGVPSIARPSSHLKAIVIPLPPIEQQNNWFTIVEPMLKSLTSKNRENKKLSLIRDTLLPKLMSGEIEVPVEV